MPRATPASFTNCPMTVLSPPASLANVMSAEKAVSSSTRPHCTQHLQRDGRAAASERAPSGRRQTSGGGAGRAAWVCALPLSPGTFQGPAKAATRDSREAVRIVDLRIHLAGACRAVNHGAVMCCSAAFGCRASQGLPTAAWAWDVAAWPSQCCQITSERQEAGN